MKIAIWGPYVGHVGTIKAMVNMAISLTKYGGHSVVLIRVHSEFIGYERVLFENNVEIVDLGLAKIFPGLARATFLARRPYMWVAGTVGAALLAKVLRQRKPDLLITNLIAAPAIFITKLCANGTKILASIQGYPKFLGLMGGDLPWWKKIEEGLRRYIWSKIYPRVDVIACLSDETKTKLQALGFLNNVKLFVTPNPIIADDMYAMSLYKIDEEWFEGKAFPKLVALGRLSHQKDFSTLIKAVKIVKSRWKNVRVGIVGDGELKNILNKQIIDLELEENVRLLGFKNNPFPFLRDADVFVLSSRWEDPGHAVIEAAALNVKIVTTDCPSGPSSLVSHGRGGWVCSVGDVKDMAEKIIEALEYSGTEKQKVAKHNSDAYTMEIFYQKFSLVIGYLFNENCEKDELPCCK